MVRNRRGRRGSRGPSVAAGSVVGAGVFVAGLIITFLSVQLELSRTLTFVTAFAGFGGGSALDGYLFSHLFIHDVGLTNGEFVARLFPFTLLMIVLQIVGGVIASAAGGGGPASGASTAVGFGAMTTLSILYLTLSFGASFELILTFMFVGVLYPVVFGGLGGLATG